MQVNGKRIALTLGNVLGAGVAALGPIVAPVLRSMTSKLVSAQERGIALLTVLN